jgi:hypothetical protein
LSQPYADHAYLFSYASVGGMGALPVGGVALDSSVQRAPLI